MSASGTVTVENNSYAIIGSGCDFLSSADVGSMITIPSLGLSAQIARVLDDNTLWVGSKLTPPVGAVLTGLSYAISRDFSPGLQLPAPRQNDVAKSDLVFRALEIIDRNIERFSGTEVISPATPTITQLDPVIAGTATPGATVQLDIGGVSRSTTAVLGAYSVDIPFLEDGEHEVAARYPGRPWSLPMPLVMPNPLKTALREQLLGAAAGLVLDFSGTQGGLILAPAVPASQYLGPAMGATVFARASTATYFDKDGILRAAAANAPRFDYDPITKVLRGLRLEGAGANLAYGSASNNSETLSGGNGASGAGNKDQVAPDGSTNASRVLETTSSGEHYASDITLAATAGDIYVWSMYVKELPGSAKRYLYLRTATAVSANQSFDAATGTWLGTGQNTLLRGAEQLPGGWWRAWICVTAASTATLVARTQLNNGSTSVYTGDGTSGLILWGRQLEKVTAARGPSSYIPALTAVTTRAADSCYLNTAGWLNGAEGSIVVDYTSEVGNDLISYSLMRTDSNGGLARGSIYQQTSTSASTVLSIRSYKDGASQPVISVGTNVAFSERCRVAASFKAGALRGCRNGGVVAGTTGFTMPTGLERLWIGNRSGLSNPLFGWVHGLKYFPTALSDAQLQALTAA